MPLIRYVWNHFLRFFLLLLLPLVFTWRQTQFGRCTTQCRWAGPFSLGVSVRLSFSFSLVYTTENRYQIIKKFFHWFIQMKIYQKIAHRSTTSILLTGRAWARQLCQSSFSSRPRLFYKGEDAKTCSINVKMLKPKRKERSLCRLW